MKVERKFEEEWREAFDGAEVTPSDAVWTGIDLELANAEGSSMKKRVVFYQRLAAASVLFALLVGGFGFYRWKETERLAAEKNKSNSTAPEIAPRVAEEKNSVGDLNKKKIDQNEVTPSTAITKDQSILIPKTETEIATNSPSKPILRTEKPRAKTVNESQPGGQLPQVAINEVKVQPTQSMVTESESMNKNSFTKKQSNYTSVELAAIPEASVLPTINIEGEPVKEELVRKLPAISSAFMMEPRHSKINHEHVWASVTAAAGNFSTITSSNSAYNNSASNALQSNSSGGQGAGSSYTFGMIAGLRVSNRIVVQSGVQYANQTIGTTTNINAPSSLDAVANFAKNSTASVSYSSPYTINSANEFISVPLQAGYLFIDRKIGLQLNSGISTDFFVRNTLSDPTGLRQSYSQSAGQDSPYRSVNFSGLMSSEVSYKVGHHYRLSLVPGMRYSFAPVLKSNAGGSTGNNMVWDIGFRFRYIFK